MRLVTLGVGAQDSPRYAPAGLLVAHRGVRVMIDGGPGAVSAGRLDAWLVTDARGELIAAIRRLAGRGASYPGWDLSGRRGCASSTAASSTRAIRRAATASRSRG